MKIRDMVRISMVLFLFTACEKDITVDLPHPDLKIVIEGAIEQGKSPYVIITRNAGYFDPVDSNTIKNMVISDAVVIVSDGQQTDTLYFGIDFYQFPFVRYLSSSIVGEIGKTYFLTVEYEGKKYTSRTLIPQPVELDSLVFRPLAENGNDSIGFIWFYFNDPDTLGNYYRYFTKTMGKDSVFVHPRSSVTDDKLVNGQFVEFPAYRGWNPNLNENEREAAEDSLKGIPAWAFVRGETVVLKYCSMDAMHYNFWRTFELNRASDGNPFAAPVSVQTNIEGGAIGVWGGYGAFYDTIKIK